MILDCDHCGESYCEDCHFVKFCSECSTPSCGKDECPSMLFCEACGDFYCEGCFFEHTGRFKPLRQRQKLLDEEKKKNQQDLAKSKKALEKMEAMKTKTPHDTYNTKYTLTQLKELMKKYKLTQKGSKAALIKKLVDYDKKICDDAIAAASSNLTFTWKHIASDSI